MQRLALAGRLNHSDISYIAVTFASQPPLGHDETSHVVQGRAVVVVCTGAHKLRQDLVHGHILASDQTAHELLFRSIRLGTELLSTE